MKRNESTLNQKAIDEKKIKQLQKEVKELEEVIATIPYGLKASELQRIARAKVMKIENLRSDKKPNKYEKCVTIPKKY